MDAYTPDKSLSILQKHGNEEQVMFLIFPLLPTFESTKKPHIKQIMSSPLTAFYTTIYNQKWNWFRMQR